MTPQALKRAIANLIDDFCVLNKEVSELREHNRYLESRVSEESDYATILARHNALAALIGEVEMKSCNHPGCEHHVTHPCEKCGRISGSFKWSCGNCGSDMIGDGYTVPVHCEFAEVPADAEPDSGPYYCGEIDDNLAE